MDDGIEQEVLEEIAKRGVANYQELAQFLEGKVDNPLEAITKVAKSLSERSLIIYVSPIGQTCLAITQKGMREARVMEQEKNGRNKEQNSTV
jgi:hypothetical protein